MQDYQTVSNSIGQSQSQSVRDFRTLQAGSGAGGSLSSLPSMRGDAANSDRFEKQFLRYFQLAHDRFVDHSLCSYQQATSMAGRLYVSDRHLCFHSKFYRRVIPMQEVQYVKKENSALVFPDGITLICRDGKKHLFHGFEQRDRLFSQLEGLLPSSVTALPAEDISSAAETLKDLVNKRRSLDLTSRESQRRSRSAKSLLNASESIQAAKTQMASHVRRLSDTLRTSKENIPEQKTVIETPAATPDRLSQAKTELDEELSANFHLPEEERVFEAPYCFMKRGGRYQPGRLYVTQHYLCFRTITGSSSIAPKLFQTSLEVVEDVRVENVTQIFPFALRVRAKSTDGHKYFRFAYVPHTKRVCEGIRTAALRFNDFDNSATFWDGNAAEMYKKHFINTNVLPPTESFLMTTRCARFDPVLRRGHLFVTDNFVCWHLINFVGSSQEIVPFRHLRKVEVEANQVLLFTEFACFRLDGVVNPDQIISVISRQKILHTELSTSGVLPASQMIEIQLQKREQRFVVGDYQIAASSFFMRSGDKRDVGDLHDWQESVFFTLPDNSHVFSLQIQSPWLSCSTPVALERKVLQFRAEKIARVAQVRWTLSLQRLYAHFFQNKDSMRLLRSQREEKILSGDGTWQSWLAHVATDEERQTIVLYGRRKRKWLICVACTDFGRLPTFWST
jgi:hypothetical protein